MAAVGLMLSACMVPPVVITCGTRSEAGFYDGWLASPKTAAGVVGDGWEGVSAEVVTRATNFCGSDSSANNIVTVETRIAADDGRGWAESGYWQTPGAGAVTFAQQSADGNTWTTVYGDPVSPGETHQYWQQYGGDCRCIRSNVDFTQLMASTFDPKAFWAYPFRAGLFGETKYAESNVPGVSTAQTTFSTILVQNYTNDLLWASVPTLAWTSVNNNGNRWSQSDPRTNGSSFAIWTCATTFSSGVCSD